MIKQKIDEALNVLQTIIEECKQHSANTFSKFAAESFGGFHFNNGTSFLNKNEMIRSLKNTNLDEVEMIHYQTLDIERYVCVVDASMDFSKQTVIFSCVFRKKLGKEDCPEIVQMNVSRSVSDSLLNQNDSGKTEETFAGLKIVDTDFVFHSIRFDDIYYVRCDKNYLYFYVVNRNNPIRVRMTFQKILEIFPENFMRIKRGVAVNIKHVESISSNEVVLRNGVTFNVSSNVRKQSKKTI